MAIDTLDAALAEASAGQLAAATAWETAIQALIDEGKTELPSDEAALLDFDGIVVELARKRILDAGWYLETVGPSGVGRLVRIRRPFEVAGEATAIPGGVTVEFVDFSSQSSGNYGDGDITTSGDAVASFDGGLKVEGEGSVFLNFLGEFDGDLKKTVIARIVPTFSTLTSHMRLGIGTAADVGGRDMITGGLRVFISKWSLFHGYGSSGDIPGSIGGTASSNHERNVVSGEELILEVDINPVRGIYATMSVNATCQTGEAAQYKGHASDVVQQGNIDLDDHLIRLELRENGGSGFTYVVKDITVITSPRSFA